jgi:hypothetical protein
MDDWQLWSDSGLNPAESRLRFKFQLQQKVSISRVLISVVEEAGSQRIEFAVEPAAALMLAFLDLEYWSRTAMQAEYNRNRIVQYLGNLREKVVQSMAQYDGGQGIAQSFLVTILTPWASRVKHGLGHSQTGRTQYITMCSKANLTPFAEDPTMFGKHPSSDFIVHTIYLSSTDWPGLARPFLPSSTLADAPCPHRVLHDCVADSRQGFLCAASLFTRWSQIHVKSKHSQHQLSNVVPNGSLKSVADSGNNDCYGSFTSPHDLNGFEADSSTSSTNIIGPSTNQLDPELSSPSGPVLRSRLDLGTGVKSRKGRNARHNRSKRKKMALRKLEELDAHRAYDHN